MTATALRRAAIALVVAAPMAARAGEVYGGVGVLFDRVDSWVEGSGHMEQPSLHLDLSLGASGSIADPRYFAWNGKAAYRRFSRSVNGEQTALTSALAYHADLAVLRYRGSPLTLTAFAAREDSTFETVAGASVAAERVVDSFGGMLHLGGAGRPKLDVGYRRTDIDETLPTTGAHTAADDVVTARFVQSGGTFTGAGTFYGSWSDGTWVTDQRSLYSVTVDGKAALRDNAELYLTDRFYHRVPDTNAAGAFSQDLNSFQGGYREGRKPGEMLLVRYLGTHGLVTSGSTSSESTSNAVSYAQDFTVGDRGDFLRPFASFSATSTTAAAIDTSATGGSVGAEYWWRRVPTGRVAVGKPSYEISGGPSVGYLETDADGTLLAYGATARAATTMPWQGYRLQAIYTANYGANQAGRAGWSLDQRLGASVEGAVGAGRGTARVNLIARRGHSELLGEEATRSVSAGGSYRWDKHTAYADLSHSNGILPGTPTDFIGDGFFLPIGFQSRSTTVTLGFSTSFLGSVTARLQGRYSASSAPGQPDLSGVEGLAAIAYRYGKFEVALEDRYYATDLMAPSGRSNIFMARISRLFGSRG